MTTSWLVPILLKMILVYVLGAWFMKRMVGLPSRTQRFFLQFLFCSIIALGFAAYRGELILSGSFFVLVLIGFFNGLAAFHQWKAIDISLSKNSLFTFWDDIIAMTLSCIILHETKVFNWGIGIGILVSLAAVILFALHSYRKSRSNQKVTKTGIAFFYYVGVYSVIWGIATFFMRYFALNQLPIGTFLAGWYSGACVAATLILLFYKEKGQAAIIQNKTAKEKVALILSGVILSLYIIIALALCYWSYELAPLNVVQPLFLVGEMVGPSLVGLYIYKEAKNLDRTEKLLFLLGIAGGTIVALSFG